MIRILLIIIFIYLIVRFILRLVAPLIIASAARKVQETMNQQFKQSDPNRPQGTIHVDYVPKKSPDPKTDKDKGEFVDFEEIK